MTDYIGMARAAIERGLKSKIDIGIPTPDGVLRRFHVEGDRAGTQNGWCVYYADGIPTACFGTYANGGLSGRWSAKHINAMNSMEKAAYKAKIEAMKFARNEERQKVYETCRLWTHKTWSNAKPAPSNHPYLKTKQVQSHGLRVFGDNTLLVPVMDMKGVLCGVQLIKPDGLKRFKSGTNKAGHFFLIGDIADDAAGLIVCEGYATGASLYEQTGRPVAVAFDAGNLLHVSLAFRAEFPNLKITIAADDDSFKPRNTGIINAIAAAKAVNGMVSIPPFPKPRQREHGTDWNDYINLFVLNKAVPHV